MQLNYTIFEGHQASSPHMADIIRKCPTLFIFGWAPAELWTGHQSPPPRNSWLARVVTESKLGQWDPHIRESGAEMWNPQRWNHSGPRERKSQTLLWFQVPPHSSYLCLSVEWSWDNSDGAWLGDLFCSTPFVCLPVYSGTNGLDWAYSAMIMTEPNHINSFFKPLGISNLLTCHWPKPVT